MPENEEIQSNDFGDKYLPSVNGDVFNRTGSRHIFQQQFKQAFWLEEYCHIVLGSDSGLLIKHLLAEGIPKGSLYLFIELDSFIEPIKHLCLHNTQWQEQIALCNLDTWLETAESLAVDNYILRQKLALHNSVAVTGERRPEYSLLGDKLKAQLNEKTHEVNACLVDETLITKTLDNISENIIPAAVLEKKFQGQTCIILGAGPSLDEHLPWIKENKDKLIILAVSRLAGQLISYDLLPDIIFSIDPQDTSFEVNKEILTLPETTLLIHSNHVTPRLVSQWPGKSLYLGERFPWDSELNVNNFADWGPTVTNTALVVAAELGFSKILLSGVDLCFESTNKTHADKVQGLEFSTNNYEITTFSGAKALTDVQMLFAAKSMSEQVEKIDTTATEIINLAGNAQKIDEIKQINCEEISLAAPSSIHWHSIIPQHDSNQAANDGEQIISELQHRAKELKKIIKLSQDALTYNKKIYKVDKAGNYNLKAKDKQDNIQKKLDTEFEHITIPLKRMGMRYFAKTLKPGNPEHWTDKEMEQQGKLYYEAYIKSAKHFLQRIELSISRVKSRLNETSLEPNFIELTKRWQEENQPGRAAVWLKRHAKKAKTIEDKDYALLKGLEQSNANNPAPDQAKSQPIAPDFNRFRKEAQFGFDNKNLESLNAIKNRTLPLTKKHIEAQSIIALINGYIEALQEKPEAALTFFDKTSEIDRNEDTLNLMFSLAIQLDMNEKAEGYLQKLSTLSPNYTPQYAHILKLNNKHLESINVYTTYLQEKPEDITTWVALGKLYIEIGEEDMALSVFSYVLEQDPENQLVQKLIR